MNSVKDVETQPPLFAQMVEKMRNKSDAELKMLYLHFFQNDIRDEWKKIAKDANFKKYQKVIS
jgi:hypothetical protein